MRATFTKKLIICSISTLFFFLLINGKPIKAIAADTVKLGILEPFTGTFEFASRVYGSGAKYVVDEMNARGGLLGKKIEIIFEDNELKPDVTTRKAKKLILEDNVDFLFAGSASHIGVAMNKIASTYKKLYINYGNTSNIIQGKEFSRYAFRVCSNAYTISSALAQLMATTKFRKLYIINQDFVGGHDAANAFKEQMKIHIPDAKIVGEDYHPFSTKDFGPYITKVLASKADAIFTTNWGPDFINLIKQARNLGLKPPFPFITFFGNEPSHLYELKDDAVGIYFAHMYELGVKTPENEEMIKKFHEQHKNDKDFITWWPASNIGQTICGLKMFFAAVEKAKSLDPEKIIETFEGFEFNTPVGRWSMRKCDHQVILPMFGGKIEDGLNPYFNGSIRPDVKFPWAGSNITTISAKSVAIPATSDYNPRCP